MSQILNGLKRAEAERELLIAERKRIEAEANAALASREREETVPQQSVARRLGPAPKRRLLAGLAALVCIAALSAALLFSGEKQSTQKEVPARPAVVAVPAVPAAQFELRLDRNADSFAARAREQERP